MILIDTAEQQPWNFSFYGVDSESRNLLSGDYAVAGKEDELLIERKKSTAELCNNLCTKIGRGRFIREFERSNAKRKILICEFPWEYMLSFPENSGIPKYIIKGDPSRDRKPMKHNGKYLRKAYYEIRDKFNLEAYFCSNVGEAEELAFNILKEYL